MEVAAVPGIPGAPGGSLLRVRSRPRDWTVVESRLSASVCVPEPSPAQALGLVNYWTLLIYKIRHFDLICCKLM